MARVAESLDLAPVRDAPGAGDARGPRVRRPLARRARARTGATSGSRRRCWPRPTRSGRSCRRLADEPATPAVLARLDELRVAYASLYSEAEAIAQSSIAAARGRAVAPAARMPAPALRIVRRVPRRYRHSVPLHWRVRIARALARGGRRWCTSTACIEGRGVGSPERRRVRSRLAVVAAGRANDDGRDSSGGGGAAVGLSQNVERGGFVGSADAVRRAIGPARNVDLDAPRAAARRYAPIGRKTSSAPAERARARRFAAVRANVARRRISARIDVAGRRTTLRRRRRHRRTEPRP